MFKMFCDYCEEEITGQEYGKVAIESGNVFNTKLACLECIADIDSAVKSAPKKMKKVKPETV